jgi:hypothetical protein
VYAEGEATVILKSSSINKCASFSSFGNKHFVGLDEHSTLENKEQVSLVLQFQVEELPHNPNRRAYNKKKSPFECFKKKNDTQEISEDTKKEALSTENFKTPPLQKMGDDEDVDSQKATSLKISENEIIPPLVQRSITAPDRSSAIENVDSRERKEDPVVSCINEFRKVTSSEVLTEDFVQKDFFASDSGPNIENSLTTVSQAPPLTFKTKKLGITQSFVCLNKVAHKSTPNDSKKLKAIEINSRRHVKIHVPINKKGRKKAIVNRRGYRKPVSCTEADYQKDNELILQLLQLGPRPLEPFNKIRSNTNLNLNFDSSVAPALELSSLKTKTKKYLSLLPTRKKEGDVRLNKDDKKSKGNKSDLGRPYKPILFGISKTTGLASDSKKDMLIEKGILKHLGTDSQEEHAKTLVEKKINCLTEAHEVFSKESNNKNLEDNFLQRLKIQESLTERCYQLNEELQNICRKRKEVLKDCKQLYTVDDNREAFAGIGASSYSRNLLRALYKYFITSAQYSYELHSIMVKIFFDNRLNLEYF